MNMDENIKTVLIEDISDLDIRFMYQGTWYQRMAGRYQSLKEKFLINKARVYKK